MQEGDLNLVLARFKDGLAGLTLTMGLGGFWVRQELNQWPITSEQADKVLAAMQQSVVA